jgi:phospholipid/cholesterol/gamma-HCH transport system substrate-binding protein
MARKKVLLIVAAAVAVLLAAGVYTATTASSYHPKLIMDSAAQLAEGSPVWINGTQVGKISTLETKGGKAIATLDLDADDSPLHDGTTSRVEWKSALGERVLTLYPGPATNAPIPDGGSFQGQSAQIEVDQVLAALDPPTRARLSGLVQRLNTTIDGRQQDIQGTLQTAGPTLQALGELLKGVGSDGPAIHAVVTQLSEMARVGAARQNQVRGVVGNLSVLTNATAQQQQQLATGLDELPSTLQTAKDTLDRVPKAADATVPLLKTLQPATARLPSVSRNLSPVLSDLRPAVAQLGPTLQSANSLLDRTPGLLDSSHGVLPGLKDTLTGVGPGVAFLRPYAPEAAGFLENFGTAFAHYDAFGSYWAGLLAPGVNAFNENPLPQGTLVPAIAGSKTDTAPAPGEAENEPWTDANGGGVR